MAVYAQLNISDPNRFAPAKFSSFQSILNIVVPNMILGASLLFLAMLLLGAFQWLTAGDNPENLKKSSKTLTFAVIGLAIVIVSFTVVKLIGLILQVNILPL